MKTNKSSELTPIRRLTFIAFGCVFLFCVLLYQFYHLQVIEHEHWIQLANRQHYLLVKDPFLRGRFLSNPSVKKAHPERTCCFVMDVQKFHLHLDPESLPLVYKREVIEHLQRLLNLPQEEKALFLENFDKKSRDRKLASWLDLETKETILKWWNPYARRHKIPLNALFFVNDYQRSYPFGKMLGQVLHTVQLTKDEKTKQAIPTGGLELTLDHYLKGKEGLRRLMRSPRNAIETGETIAVPENGADVILTINHGLQAIAEEELAKGVKKANAKSGWVVMMDPFTGEILAFAQYPFFYPQDYPRYFNDPDLLLSTQPKAITEAREPGSIMKPFTVAIALKANRVLKSQGKPPFFDPHAKMATSNSYFPGRGRPLVDTSLHYYLNMYMALQKSSNIYMARLMDMVVQQLGSDFYRRALQDIFGFGIKTHIELPGETAGLLPTPGKKHPNGALEWSVATPSSLAMGYNVMVNSVQMVRAISVFANGGFLVQPTLIKKIVKSDALGQETVLLDHTQAERRQQFPHVLEQEVIDEVITALKYCTKTGGAAARGNVWGYTEVGKSGTAKKIVNGAYCDRYSSSFLGFCPVNQPAFAMVVTLDEPEYGFIPGVGKKHHGGFCSAPIFREIARRSLEYMGIAPDDPHGYPKGDPRFDPELADWYPETKKLKELYDAWNEPYRRKK